ncbi:TRAP transporter small permease [Consotaella aegiceratis]|uniref:TRAP transporter small permease n=1 Tax=Consotaella aegiceratis TaxID=3097961 RepID=UPI002F3E4F1D
MRTISKILSVIATVGLWVSGAGLVLMTAFTAWQVWGRYVLNNSPSWTEPSSVVLMGWFIFLGAAIGVREGYHLGFDILLVSLPEGPRKILMTVSDILVLCFGFGMMWFGYGLVAGTWSDPMPAIGIPTGLTYLPPVIGGFLIAVFSLERIVLRFSSDEQSNPNDLQQIDTVA